jgi:hypothetical protein
MARRQEHSEATTSYDLPAWGSVVAQHIELYRHLRCARFAKGGYFRVHTERYAEYPTL